jgi:hypothetical protein
MKKIFVLLCIASMVLFFISVPQSASTHSKRQGQIKPHLNFGKLPLYFIANKGQVNKKAVFYAKTARYTLWLTKDGLVFDSTRSPHSTYSTKYLRDVSRFVFIAADKKPEIVPIKETKLRVNYFIGNDKSGWHGSIPTSRAVLYKSLYKYIDLKVYGIEKQIEYDWIVKPGGDPGDIRFQYKNVKGTRLDEQGNLLIATDFGELIHKKPVGYQRPGAGPRACPSGNKQRIDVDVTFKKIAENTYGFEVGEYDNGYELIIDPVVLAYSTYIGGGETDYGFGAALDGSGYIYMTGWTTSTDFPTVGQYQKDPGDGSWDAFVIKLDPSGSGTDGLIYSTYLGGKGYDDGFDIAVDNNGYAYVTGDTSSPDFPTLHPIQTDRGSDDVFVSVLDTTQTGVSSLIYSTYLGGEDYEDGFAIAVDDSGYVYVTGVTKSWDFPTVGQFQNYHGGGERDVFVTKIDPTRNGASGLIYSTYLGGNDYDSGIGIAVDAAGSGVVYVTGETYSKNFPLLNPYQDLRGLSDAFVTGIDTTRTGASSLVYSTCLGGDSDDAGIGIAVDGSGYIYVTGQTFSSNFPTLNPYQTDPGDRSFDAFVTRIDPTRSGASALLYSTYLGGERQDNGIDITVDNSGCAYITGNTESPDFPVLNPYQTYRADYDAFVAKLDTGRKGTASLIYSTYLGGNMNDAGWAIAVDTGGNAYVAGRTLSTDFPTRDPYGTDPGDSRYDAFVAILSFPTTVLPTVTGKPVVSITPTSAVSGGDVTSGGGAPVTARGVCWSTSPRPTISDNFTLNGTGIGTFTSSITGLTPNTTYYLRAYATNAAGTAYSDQFTFTTPYHPTISGTVTHDSNPAAGVTITFSHDGHTETTDAGGYYSYTVPYGTSTTVTASKPAYSFTPSQYTYSCLTVDKPNQDFTVLDFISVTIVNPHDGDTVSGKVNIEAEVSSTNPGSPASSQPVTNVEFYIDGVLVKKDNKAPYKHPWDTGPVTNGNHTVRAKAIHSSGLTHQHEIAVNVYNAPDPPHIKLNREWLKFGAIIGVSHTPSQVFFIHNSGEGTLNWTASVSDTWIQASPLVGTGNMKVTVSVNVTGLAPGTYTGTIKIIDPDADNSPQSLAVYLQIKKKAQEEPPFGSFDTPADGAVVSGSIPVTGWALDDVEVTGVKIYRGPVEGHETGTIYIGDAVFVEGARPDIEGKHPQYPGNHRAGWGYMLLTNFLPNQGNGTFVITAAAADSSGNNVTLGSKTITCDNADAVKPFGAIDTPTQGGTASGNAFVNFGWALASPPKTIPKDGSTIKVWVDGVPLPGHPVYNNYRQDIAGAFPNYNNSSGAVGYYYLDTTHYDNGVHTIAWTVADDAGHTDGIGSRYFTIQNTGVRTAQRPRRECRGGPPRPANPGEGRPGDYSTPVGIKKGYNRDSKPQTIYPNNNGDIYIEIKELEPIEIHLTLKKTPPMEYSGYMTVGGHLEPLPIGSSFDAGRGVFYWQPGPGFIGEYRFVFINKEQGKFKKKAVKVVIKPG